MNYLHEFHAGNFADVVKHAILIVLLKSFLKKPTPFCYIETHAGAGGYDLAQRREQDAAEIIWSLPNCPAVLFDYVSCLQVFNSSKELTFYPGSPLIAEQILRPDDRLLLNEIAAPVSRSLEKMLAKKSRYKIFTQDGYAALKALLPPLERRGLVFIDPPFESEKEFKMIIQALEESLTRWLTGVYVIWYPIKGKRECLKFYRDLKTLNVKEIYVAELTIHDDYIEQMGLNGCGMAVLNPPWQTDERIKLVLETLWPHLSSGQKGNYRLEWLKKAD